MEAEDGGLWCLHITGKDTEAQRDMCVTGEMDPESKASLVMATPPGLLSERSARPSILWCT